MKGRTTSTVTVVNAAPEIKTLIDAIKTKDIRKVEEFVNNNGVDSIKIADDKGFTPMHWAAFQERFEIVRYLADLKAEISSSNNAPKQRPIHWAAVKGDIDTVNLLLSLGEDINARDSKGYTPLITCAQYGHIPCVSFMIRKGANLELEDQNGDNAMHWAAYKGHSELVSLLIFYGLNPKRQDNFGQTALHLACINGSLSTVKVLVDLIDINAKDNNGNTASDIAKGRHFTDAQDLLNRRSGIRLAKSCDLRTFFFGPVGNSKNIFIFCHIVLLVFQYPIYIMYAMPYTYTDVPNVHYAYWFLNVILWILFYGAHMVPAGYLPKNTIDYHNAIRTMTYQASIEDMNKKNSRLCHTCQIVRPYRSSHCKSCNRCVLAYDHHCPYIQNCVGYNNRVWFFWFVFSVWGVATFNGYFTYLVVSKIGLWVIAVWFAIFFTIMFEILGGSLSIFAVINIIMNLTANESVKTKKYEYLMDSNGNYRNIFNKGIIYNFKYFFHLVEPSRLETSAFEYNDSKLSI